MDLALEACDGAVFVMGSVNHDLLIMMERRPQPGETVHARAATRALGGKGANQAVAAARAGAQCHFVGAVGTDEIGRDLIEQLRGFGVGVAAVDRIADRTGEAVVLIAPDDNQIIVIPGANQSVDLEIIGSLPVLRGDICLTQMETSPLAVQKFLDVARDTGALSIFNPAPASADCLALLPQADIIVLNESEFAFLASATFAEGLESGYASMMQALGLSADQAMIVTMGSRGAYLMKDGYIHFEAAPQVISVDTTGAGDCFCGYLAAALARGCSLQQGMRDACVAGALTVQGMGASQSMPSRDQVRALLTEMVDGC